MATITLPTMAHSRKGRVVRPLIATTPVAPPAPAAVPAADGRSAFWDNLNSRLAQGDAGLQLMSGIGTSIAGIETHFNGLSVPTSFDVNVNMVPAQVELFTRGVTAIETLAAVASAPPQDGCSTLEKMSDLAFMIVKHIVYIASHLMRCRDDGNWASLRKLDSTVTKVGSLLKESDADEAKQAFQLVVAATHVDSLNSIMSNRETLFAELNHRAALLVAAQCLVAGHVKGDSDELSPSLDSAPSAPLSGSAAPSNPRTPPPPSGESL